MAKISVFGAGNVGSTTALRIAQEGLGDVVMVDVAGGAARGKALDLEDAAAVMRRPYAVEGTDDAARIAGSDVVVITAGLPRRPGMTREELLQKNAAILEEICESVKEHSSGAIVIVVTNPLDVMTNYALRITGFNPRRLFGMGVSLDAARFINLLSRELAVSVCDIDACVIGSHGEGMLPLARFTTVKGVSIEELLPGGRIEDLVKRTIGRGAEIVGHLGTGSAYFAPSAAIAQLVKAVIRDEKRIIGVCARLNGEYGIKDVCVGVPCRIGREGIEQIIELDLEDDERAKLEASAESIRSMAAQL